MNLVTTDWRERTTFLRKGTRYVFSMDIYLTFDPGGYSFVGQDLRIRAGGTTASERVAWEGTFGKPSLKPSDFANLADTYHVFNDELVSTLDGAVHEVPMARIVALQDWITVGRDGVLQLNGRARLMTDDGAAISMAYTGVVHLGFAGVPLLLSGDITQPDRAKTSVEGSVQVATRYDVDRPRYRWLTLSQLIGFGKAEARLLHSKAKVMKLSVDLYSAG